MPISLTSLDSVIDFKKGCSTKQVMHQLAHTFKRTLPSVSDLSGIGFPSKS